jgi:hypothetical protein
MLYVPDVAFGNIGYTPLDEDEAFPNCVIVFALKKLYGGVPPLTNRLTEPLFLTDIVGSVTIQSTYIGNNVFITHSFTVTSVVPPDSVLKFKTVTSGHGKIF